jgi:hypothetical protein
MNGEPPRDGLPATCPSCGATVRADVSWCTQCYAPLRASQEPGDPQPEHPAADASTADAASATTRPGRTADRAEVDRLAEQMLAQLAAERDDLPGLASRMPRTPGARAVLVTLVIVGGVALVLLLMFVLGTIF